MIEIRTVEKWQTRITAAAIAAITVSCLALPQAEAVDEQQLQQLRVAIEAFGDEPDIHEVQRRVMEHRDIDDDRPDRWTRRARLSNLVPRFRGRASWLDQRDRQDRFREDVDADDEGDYERNRAQHLWRDDLRLRAVYSLQLDFDLGDVVYTRDEMAIQRELRNRWRMRDDLLEEVTDLYFERRRLQLETRLFPDDDPEVMLARLLEIEALTAHIDAMTGGWFRQQLEEGSP